MHLQMAPECSEILIDLVCYELYAGRISPETERLFAMHLEHCAACRRMVHDYQKTLAEADRHRNFG